MTDIRIALKAQGMVPGACPHPAPPSHVAVSDGVSRHSMHSVPLPAETTCPPAATAAQGHTVAGKTQSPPASSRHPEPQPCARSPTPHELPSHPLALSMQARTKHALPYKHFVCLHAKYSAIGGPRRGSVCAMGMVAWAEPCRQSLDASAASGA